ncbi:MAG: hypothetical protein ACI9FW_000580 [Flavobacterium sp.]|jgi:hypothetical protein
MSLKVFALEKIIHNNLIFFHYQIYETIFTLNL